MAWVFLILAGLFEVGWAVGLRYSQGFSKALPSTLTAIAVVLSMYFLALALRTLPLGSAYAIWTGIGTVGTALLGIFLFGESQDPIRLLFLALIVIGIVGLKLVSP